MKWLLIGNTNNANPGDEFIRIGVQMLISRVDPKPSYTILNKQLDHEHEPVEFDRAIWCGSPMFWSHSTNDCWTNYWWRPWLDGWAFKDPRKMLVLGVGNMVGAELHDPVNYWNSVDEVRKKCWKLITRNPLQQDIEVSVCPSVFCLMDRPNRKMRLLCNFMEGGGHDAFLNEKESKLWLQILPEINARLRNMDYEFVAHSNDEVRYAQVLGWPPEKIHGKFETPEQYLDLYADCAGYVGNRLHGAMAAISARAPVWAFGLDSRLGMVRRANGKATLPSEWQGWSDLEPCTYDPFPDFHFQIELLKQFADLPLHESERKAANETL